MKTLAIRCSRARYYSPEVMQVKFVRAAFDTVYWDNTEEVTTLFYLTKNLVQGGGRQTSCCLTGMMSSGSKRRSQHRVVG